MNPLMFIPIYGIDIDHFKVFLQNPLLLDHYLIMFESLFINYLAGITSCYCKRMSEGTEKLKDFFYSKLCHYPIEQRSRM